MRLHQVGRGADPAILTSFRCSTGRPYETEVEQWINRHAIAWANDLPRAVFQRRVAAIADGDDVQPVGVVAWQDIVRVDIEGIWLEVLAVALDHQHRGMGRVLLDATIAHLRTVDREGDHLAGLVHPDNIACKRLLTSAGWTGLTTMEGHELWVGTL